MEEIYKNLSLENIEGEVWLQIEGYEGLYEVSNMGRVKSLANDKSRKEKILSQTLNNNNGYLQLMLCKKGKIKTCYVHRLVALAFLENPNGYRCVNHKDECKTNNCVDNLEWCDDKYNLNYGKAQARRVAHTDYKARTAKIDYKSIAEKKTKRVYQYDKNGELVAIWQSVMECDRNDFIRVAVSQCCRNCYMREGNNVYKNYIWSYTPIDSK